MLMGQIRQVTEIAHYLNSEKSYYMYSQQVLLKHVLAPETSQIIDFYIFF